MPTSELVPNETLKASDACLDLIMGSEGFRKFPYPDCAGVLTVGYGHKVTSHEFDGGINLKQALVLLDIDKAVAEGNVRRLVSVPLTQGQFDALVDFDFNEGKSRLEKSTLLERLNAGDYEAVPDQLYRVDPDGTQHGWIYAHEEVAPGVFEARIEPGLVKRRQKEIELWRAA